MLVFAREKDQVIEIGDGITVTVIDIRGSKVRLGVTAPADVPIHRHEVAEAIRREAASLSLPTPPPAGGAG